MINIKNTLIALWALGLTACASTPFNPIKMDQNLYQNKDATVGVYIVAPDKVDTYLDGASCLLCYAAAAAANGSLTKHMKTLDVNDFTAIKTDLVEILQEKGMNAQLVEAKLALTKLKKFKPKSAGFAEQDYTPLKAAAGVDKLLILQVNMLGAQRFYNGYVPTSSPSGAVSAKMFMVDLTSNKLELDQRINERVAVEGEWDEPTSFPGVTSAFYEAVERAKIQIKQQL